MTSQKMTNEELKGICGSNFELAHYAIALGRYFIASGRETELSGILKEVKRHPNPQHLEELKAIDEIESQHNAEDMYD